MNRALSEIVRDVQSRAKENPGGGVSSGTDLSLEILRSGMIADFDESDLLDAARRIGMSDDEAVGWLESLASWWV